MASTRGRSEVIPLTNKSGGSVAAGDVVIIDTSNDTAFTTTTSGRSEVSIGVAQETIANNASGRVLVSGYAALINVPSSVTRGHYIETHTVAKQATGNSTRRSGSFGQFFTGGTTPTGWLWGSTDQTAAGGGEYIRLTESVAGAGGSASFDLTSISGSYRHLVLECVLRSEKAATADNCILRVNNDSGSNYDISEGYAFGSTAGAQETVAGTSWALECPADNQAAGIFAFYHIIIPYYANTVIQKVARIQAAEVIANSAGNRTTRMMTAAWRSTSAITRLTFSFAANDLDEGSSVSLYGIS